MPKLGRLNWPGPSSPRSTGTKWRYFFCKVHVWHSNQGQLTGPTNSFASCLNNICVVDSGGCHVFMWHVRRIHRKETKDNMFGWMPKSMHLQQGTWRIDFVETPCRDRHVSGSEGTGFVQGVSTIQARKKEAAFGGCI